MGQNPEYVLFVRRALQYSQTEERLFTITRHTEVVGQCVYIYSFTLVRQYWIRLDSSTVPSFAT